MSQHPPERITPLPTDDEKCAKILEAFAPLRDIQVRKPREFYVYKGIGYGGVYIDALELPISHDKQNEDAIWSANRDKYHLIEKSAYTKLEALNLELVEALEELDYEYGRCDAETINESIMKRALHERVKALISKAKGGV